MARPYTDDQIRSALYDALDHYEFDTLDQGLGMLLTSILTEQYQFNGKRPFGDSGWYCAIDDALTRLEPKAKSTGFGGNAAYIRAAEAVVDFIFSSAKAKLDAGAA